ncbi:MAG TPA: DUF6766 family protein [Gaiellaceae bacterium]|nr:DUF6766 family protein [Gaiellaceae bacterium]
MERLRRFVYENGLSLFFFVLFLAAVVGQSVSGLYEYNHHQVLHDEPTVSYLRYLRSSDFGADLLENWQSEWLQFWVFALGAIWFVQKGSNESKRLGEEGLEDDQQQRVGRFASEESPRWAKAKDWRFHLYANSFGIVMAIVFLATWLGQSFTAWTAFNDEQTTHGGATVAWTRYVVSSDFWERSLQNWQSEFLAVGTMVAFTIYLRQRGSPESKPVGAPHEETGSSG